MNRSKIPDNLLFSKRDVLRIVLPLIAEQFLAMLVGMADSIMIAGVGEAAVSAVSLVNQVTVLLINLFAALATGGAVIAGQYLGKRDSKGACHISDQLILSLLTVSVGITAILFLLRGQILGIVFGSIDAQVMTYAQRYLAITAFSLPFIALYNASAAIFRTMADSRTPMFISMLMNLINITGNAILIYGLKWKIEGAAVPTLLSNMTAAIIALVLLRNANRELNISRFTFKFDGAAIKRILAIGIPNGVENSMFQFGKLIVVSLIATFGTSAITANAVGNAVGIFQILPGLAIGMASVPIISRCYGAGAGDQVKYYAHRLLRLSYVFNIALNALFMLLVPVILKAYKLTDETSALATWVLIFSGSISALIWPSAFEMANAFRATGDVKFTMVVSVCSMWIWRVGGSWLLGSTLGLGLKGVWYGMALDWVFRSSFYYVRLYGKKWRLRIAKGA